MKTHLKSKTHILLGTLLFFLIFLASFAHASNECISWKNSENVAHLDHLKLPEISGMAASSTFERLYYLNDSEKKPKIHFTNLKGQNLAAFELTGVRFRDTEALSLAPCPHSQKECIYIADSGDNSKKRTEFSLYILEEKEVFSAQEKPLFQLKLKLPGKAMDIEAFQVHPVSGDFYFFSKSHYTNTTEPSQVYRLPRPTSIQLNQKKPISLEWFYELNLSQIYPKSICLACYSITDFNIPRMGAGFFLLTYDTAYSFYFDIGELKNKKLSELVYDQNFTTLPLKNLPQQEALAFHSPTSTLYYTTELSAYVSDQKTVDLMKIECIQKK